MVAVIEEMIYFHGTIPSVYFSGVDENLDGKQVKNNNNNNNFNIYILVLHHFLSLVLTAWILTSTSSGVRW